MPMNVEVRVAEFGEHVGLQQGKTKLADGGEILLVLDSGLKGTLMLSPDEAKFIGKALLEASAHSRATGWLQKLAK